jgi:hypothetical protein
MGAASGWDLCDSWTNGSDHISPISPIGPIPGEDGSSSHVPRLPSRTRTTTRTITKLSAYFSQEAKSLAQ